MNDEAEFLAAEKAFKPRSSASVITAALLGLLLGGVVGAGVMAATGGAQTKRAKVSRSAAPASAAPSASAPASAVTAPAGPSLVERARAGEPDAIKVLESRPREQRSAEEATALAHARAAAKRAEIAELKRKITLVPKVAEDKATLERVKELTADREVSTDVLSMLASLPGNVGTDLLYTLYRDMRASSESGMLAEDLLYSKDVKEKLSPALAALLELRKAEKCEDALASLKRVKEDGDRRALSSLVRFHNKRGCGPKKMDDCWRCLRFPDILKEVLGEVVKRPAP